MAKAKERKEDVSNTHLQTSQVSLILSDSLNPASHIKYP